MPGLDHAKRRVISLDSPIFESPSACCAPRSCSGDPYYRLGPVLGSVHTCLYFRACQLVNGTSSMDCLFFLNILFFFSIFFFVVVKLENLYFASYLGFKVKPLGVCLLGPRSSSCGPTKGTPPPRTTLCAN